MGGGWSTDGLTYHNVDIDRSIVDQIEAGDAVAQPAVACTSSATVRRISLRVRTNLFASAARPCDFQVCSSSASAGRWGLQSERDPPLVEDSHRIHEPQA